MKNRIAKIWKKIDNKSGMTLVELIVVFALVGIFMVAATFILTTSLRMFERIQATSQAVTVSDLILDKISGEIAAAEIPRKNKEGYYFWLEPETETDPDASWVAFCNRSGSPISIYADDDGEFINGLGAGKKKLYIKYYKIAENERSELNEINWHFDDRVYMNYQISELKFSQPDSAHPNVIRIDLSITNEKNGFEYSTFRYAENYNFEGKYMCARSDGEFGFPIEAQEFKIVTSGGNPDNPEKPDGGLFQDTIPLDPNGWLDLPRKEDGNLSVEVGEKYYTVYPGGIFLWEGFYYVVTEEISGKGWSMQSPIVGNEAKVLQIKDVTILDYDVEKETASEWNGSMYHGRVFLYRGDYFAYKSYEPLKSPDERPNYWYKIP